MGNPNLTLEIAAKAIGQESIDRLSEALNRFSANSESAASRATKAFNGVEPAAGHASGSIRRLFLAIKDLGEGRTSFATVEAGYFIQSLGGVATAAVGAAAAVAALGYGIYKAGEIVREGGPKMALAFDGLNRSLALTNDELRVTGDRLKNEIAKFEGKPIDALALSLDEARVNADKLADSVGKAVAGIGELLKKDGIGRFNAILTRRSSTNSDEKNLTEFGARIAGIDRQGVAAVRAAKDEPSRKQAQDDWNKRALAEIDKESAEFKNLVSQSETLAKLHTKGGLSPEEVKSYIAKFGPIETGADESARLAERRGTLDNLNEIRDRYSLTTGNNDAEEKRNKAEAAHQIEEKQKQAAAKQAEEDKRANEIARSETARSITSPAARTFYTSALRTQEFPATDYDKIERDYLNGKSNGIAPGAGNREKVAAAGLSESLSAVDAERKKAIQDVYEGYAKSQAEDARALSENFHQRIHVGEEAIAADRKVIELQDSLTQQTGVDRQRKIQYTESFSDRQIAENSRLSDAQKIAGSYQSGQYFASQRYQAAQSNARDLLDPKKRLDALHEADLRNEEDLQRLKETNLERLADLQNRNAQQFASTVVAGFDAVTQRFGRATALRDFGTGLVRNFTNQVVGNAATLAFNSAPVKAITSSLSSVGGSSSLAGGLLKGTLFEAGGTTDLKDNSSKVKDNTDAINNLTDTLNGKSTSSGGSGGIAGLAKVAGGGIVGTGSSILKSVSGLFKGPDPYAADEADYLNGGSGGQLGITGISGSTNRGSSFSGLSGLASGLSHTGDLAGIFTGVGNNAESLSTSERVGAGVGSAAAAATGAIAAYSGFKKGGASGALQGVGAIAGTAAIFDPEPISKAALAGVAVVTGLLSSVFGSGPQKRELEINKAIQQNQYLAPTALNVSQDTSGNYTDFNSHGELRTSSFRAVPQVSEPYLHYQSVNGQPGYYDVPGSVLSPYSPGTAAQAPVVNNYNTIQAVDARSFADMADRNHAAIGDAVAKTLQNGNSRLANTIRQGV